jgi:hypothetical protein
MTPSTQSNDPLDALLRQWRDVNALSKQEVSGIRSRVLDRAASGEAGLSLEWWKECLGAGFRPLRYAISPMRLAFVKADLS